MATARTISAKLIMEVLEHNAKNKVNIKKKKQWSKDKHILIEMKEWGEKGQFFLTVQFQIIKVEEMKETNKCRKNREIENHQ